MFLRQLHRVATVCIVLIKEEKGQVWSLKVIYMYVALDRVAIIVK